MFKRHFSNPASTKFNKHLFLAEMLFISFTQMYQRNIVVLNNNETFKGSVKFGVYLV